MILRCTTLVFLLTATTLSFASPYPGPRFDAKEDKTNKYIEHGFFVGGNSSVGEATLKSIRRSYRNGTERIVFELESDTSGSLDLPHYQVQVAPKEKRIIVSIWAEIHDDKDLDKGHILKSIDQSPVLSQLIIPPRLEKGLAIFELKLSAKGSKKPKVEVFHLKENPRIVIDIL